MPNSSFTRDTSAGSASADCVVARVTSRRIAAISASSRSSRTVSFASWTRTGAKTSSRKASPQRDAIAMR